MDSETIEYKKIIKVENQIPVELNDALAVEEALEISISILKSDPIVFNKSIAVTMRTPGHDAALALGFLFGEGIIRSYKQINAYKQEGNKINIFFNENEKINLKKLERHFYVSSSCGVCGKSSIDAVRAELIPQKNRRKIAVKSPVINNLFDQLKMQQDTFQRTGGLHAAALFDLDGNFLNLKEDVGRHNALDKLIGANLMDSKFNLDETLLLLSGRSSFELIQKSAMAGIQFVISVGAPSSLAVSLAEEFDITLVGFLSKLRFNIYNGKERILF